MIAYRGCLDYVCAVAWSPSGKWVASGAGDGTVRVWDAADGTCACTYLGHTAPVNAVAWAHSGSLLVSGGEDHTAQIWDAETGTCRLAYRGHTNGIYALAWSPDGKRIASASSDRTVQIWDVGSGVHHLTYRGHECIARDPRVIGALSWSPSGFYLASGGEDETVQVWDTSTGKLGFLFDEKDFVNNVAWLQNGERLLCANSKRVSVYDAGTGETSFTYTAPNKAFFHLVVPSPDGTHLASGDDNRVIRIWRTGTGETVFAYRGHSDAPLAFAWSPDSRRIASCSNQDLSIWLALSG